MKKAFPEAKVEILERARDVSQGAGRQWGGMTVHQMVCHLNDSYLLGMGERKVADKSNMLTRNFVRVMALRAPMQWPKGIKTVREFDQVAGAGTRTTVFEADKAQLLFLIERFTTSPRDFQFARHPMFGEMSEWEWQRWGYLHADHHLRQFGL